MAAEEAEIKAFYTRDVAQDKQLLASAGVPNGFDMELAIGNFGDTYISMGELMAAQLKEIGINLKLRVVTTAEWTPIVVAPGNYSGATLGPIATFASATTGSRLTVKIESRCGSTVTVCAGAGRWPFPRARRV